MTPSSFPKLTILFTVFVCFLIAILFRWNGNDYKNKESVIRGDGLGYYSYLPATFINKNLNNQEYNPIYTTEINGKHVNKYYVGTAILMYPFFAVAFTSSILFDKELNGYSEHFQFMILLAGIFYLLIGLFFLNELLKLFEITPQNRMITVLLIVFGTNLLYYSTILMSMSHIYSFSLITSFLFVAKKQSLQNKASRILILAVLISLIILVRPVNGLVILLIPAMADGSTSVKNMLQHLIKNKTFLILAFIVSLFILSIQPLLWYLQTGSFFVWSYSNEGFYLLDPEIYNVLFSFRKGWFIYTPLAFLSLIGLFVILKKSLFQFLVISFFLLILVYVISSWWNWYYGDSFGMRPFIDYYGLIGLLLALTIQHVKLKLKRLFIAPLIILSLILNLFQSYQMYAGVLSGSEMTFEKYKYAFLKSSDQYAHKLGGNRSSEPYGKHQKELIYSFKNDYENDYPFWNNQFLSITQENPCSNEPWKGSSYFNNQQEYGTKISLSYDSLYNGMGNLFVECSLNRLEIDLNSSSDVLLTINIKNQKNETVYFYGFKINDVPTKHYCVWKKYNYIFDLPVVKGKNNTLNISLWNIKKQKYYIDNFLLNIYNKK